MKKRIVSLIALVLMLSMLFGCSSPNANNDELLNDAEKNLMLGYSNYDGSNDIPDDLAAAFDFMVQNYTDGVHVIDEDDVQEEEIVEEEEKENLEKKSEDVKAREDIAKAMVKALSTTEPSVNLKIPADLYTEDLLMDIFENDINGIYPIEAMGVNALTQSFYRNYADKTVVVELTFTYLNYDGFDNGCTLDELRRMKKEAKAEAERVVEKLNLKALSDYEKVKAVNDYLCDIAEYSEGVSPYEPIQHTVYGCLIDGDCVCEGYAKAAQLLFQMSGLETYYVVGDTAGGGHAWNIVKVDGEYYQLDVTWNDVPGYENEFFLVTDEYMKHTRVWDYSKFPKTAKKPYKG